MAGLIHLELLTDFFNRIGAKRTLNRIYGYTPYPPGIVTGALLRTGCRPFASPYACAQAPYHAPLLRRLALH
jgi:hypothetical protein